jgi:hypothetical protein
MSAPKAVPEEKQYNTLVVFTPRKNTLEVLKNEYPSGALAEIFSRKPQFQGGIEGTGSLKMTLKDHRDYVQGLVDGRVQYAERLMKMLETSDFVEVSVEVREK